MDLWVGGRNRNRNRPPNGRRAEEDDHVFDDDDDSLAARVAFCRRCWGCCDLDEEEEEEHGLDRLRLRNDRILGWEQDPPATDFLLAQLDMRLPLPLLMLLLLQVLLLAKRRAQKPMVVVGGLVLGLVTVMVVPIIIRDKRLPWVAFVRLRVDGREVERCNEDPMILAVAVAMVVFVAADALPLRSADNIIVVACFCVLFGFV